MKSFTSFFLYNLSAFNVSFFWLILPARIFSAVPNGSGENGHLCLISGLCTENSSFSPLKCDGNGDLLCFNRLREFPYICILLTVFLWMDVGFCQLLSLCLLGWFAIWACHLFPARTLTGKNAHCKMKHKWWSSLFLHQWIIALTWGLFSQPFGFNRFGFKICPQIIWYSQCQRWSPIPLLGCGLDLVTHFW